MTLRLRLSARALRDLDRLPDFLSIANPSASDRVRQLLLDGLASLTEFPARNPNVSRTSLRELSLRFGKNGYVIRYRVSAEEVFVTRLLHTRERR